MNGINPNRLHEIRIVRNMKLDQLANALGITKQAVSKYEHGKSAPAPETLQKMLGVLQMPQQYLYKSDVALNRDTSPLFFRASSNTLKGHMEYANIICLWGYEIIHAIHHVQGAEDYSFDESSSIPERAMELRKQWDIGVNPIDNLTDLLERHGYYIFIIDSAELETDAYSRLINGVPVIVLNKHKGTAVRWRFNLAHELGHLVLHKRLSDWEFRHNNKELEQEANLFAEYFLMPASSFARDVRTPELEELVRLKEKWGVSIGAMIYHCGQLGIIEAKKIKSLQIQLSSKGWKKTEPLDDRLEFETPHKVREMVAKQAANPDLLNAFLEKAGLPLDEIARICSLPPGYFDKVAPKENMDQHQVNDPEQLTLF